MSEFSSETEGTLSTMILKYKEKIMHFQHKMAQNLHFYSIRRIEHSDKILKQSKTQTEKGKQQILSVALWQVSGT